MEGLGEPPHPVDQEGSGRGQGKNGGLVVGHVDVGAVAVRHVRGIMLLPCGGCPLHTGFGLGPWMNMTYVTADLYSPLL